MVESEQQKLKVRRVLLRCLMIGTLVGFAFGVVAEPAVDKVDLWGIKFSFGDFVGILYMFFCVPAIGLLPWQIHDIPVLRGGLSGLIWGLMAFVLWWLFRRLKARMQRSGG